jgi:hypothetical protein
LGQRSIQSRIASPPGRLNTASSFFPYLRSTMFQPTASKKPRIFWNRRSETTPSRLWRL